MRSKVTYILLLLCFIVLGDIGVCASSHPIRIPSIFAQAGLARRFRFPNVPRPPLNEKLNLKSTQDIKEEILNIEGSTEFISKGNPNISVVSLIDNINADFDASRILFVLSPILIAGNSAEHPAEINFKNLMIAESNNIVFENLDITGDIRIFHGAHVIFRNCRVNCGELFGPDIIIESSGSSCVFFENCEMYGNCNQSQQKVAVALSDNSYGYFSNCNFSCSNAGVLSESAHFQAFDCNFRNSSRKNLIFRNNSQGFINGCIFDDQDGMFIVSSKSQLDISECKFRKDISKFDVELRKNNSISLFNGNNSKISNCEFSDLPGVALCCSKESGLKVKDCKMNHIGINGINIAFSNGDISCCTFDNFQSYSPIFIYGDVKGPTIENCKIMNTVEPAICVCEVAAPVIKDIYISGVKGNTLISCSEFSAPVINNITFDTGDVVPSILVSGLSTPKIKLSPDIEIERIAVQSILDVPEIKASNLQNKIKVVSFDHGKPIICDEGDSLNPEKIDLSNIDIPAYKAIGEDKRKISNKCGHVVDPQLFENGHNCCRTCGEKVDRIIGIYTSEVCLVCLEDNPSSIVLPCGHKCFCADCAYKCKLKLGKCPLCTTRIRNIRYDFADDSQYIKK